MSYLYQEETAMMVKFKRCDDGQWFIFAKPALRVASKRIFGKIVREYQVSYDGRSWWNISASEYATINSDGWKLISEEEAKEMISKISSHYRKIIT